MFIFAFLSIFLIPSYAEGRNVDRESEADGGDWSLFLSSSREPQVLPNYNIGHWVQQLHLQECAVVEIGEGFCALFVELRSIPSTTDIPDSSGVGEFFLGLCSCATLRSWTLCSKDLTEQRRSECAFTEAVAAANTSARVHRRFCDVTLLSRNAPPCNCSLTMAGQQLYRTEGFPTCFRNPLPESLCLPRGVCGVARCKGTTIRGIHSPQCDSECHQKQPIVAHWSRWSSPVCNSSCGQGFMVTTAICRNLVTGKPAIDCIGPGSFCCPELVKPCTCDVNIRNGVMTATRAQDSCMSSAGCKSETGLRFFEKIDPVWRESQDGRYEEADHLDQDTLEESMEYISDSEYEEPSGPLLRQLLASDYRSDDYDPWEQESRELDGKKRVAVDDDNDYDSEDEDSDDEDEEVNFVETDRGDLNSTEPRDLYEYVRRSDDPRLRAMPKRGDDLEDPDGFNDRRRVMTRARRGSDAEEEDCDDGKTEEPQYVDYDATDFPEKNVEGSDSYEEEDFSSPRENTQTTSSPAHLKWHLSIYLSLVYLV